MKYNIDETKIPNHIGIIMDGNGRYAERKGLPRTFGHKDGAENLKKVTRYAKDLGVKHLTVYAFSTENWKRPSTEVAAIMKLMEFYVGDWRNQLGDDHLRIRIIGDISRCSARLQDMIHNIERETENETEMNLNIALGYGGRNEIVEAARALARQCADRQLTPEDITEDLMSQNMYTCFVEDPELIIRTGGEVRTSNFLLWQSAYSEYYFTDVLWPDFSKDDLLAAIYAFQNRNRRYGGLNKS